LTANEIARRTGLHKQTISRFLNGYDLMLSSAELVAEVTGIELRFRPKRMTSTFDMEGGGA
jgi:transcriptional regulator with XRE-family HTH domain